MSVWVMTLLLLANDGHAYSVLSAVFTSETLCLAATSREAERIAKDEPAWHVMIGDRACAEETVHDGP